MRDLLPRGQPRISLRSSGYTVSVRPREGGDPGPNTLTERLGPRFRGDERAEGLPKNVVALIHPIQLSKSASLIGPRFGRAWGLPVSFLSPHEGFRPRTDRR